MALTKISGDVLQQPINIGVATVTSFNVGSAVTINNSGINVTGVVTSTSFSGSLTGNVTGNATSASSLVGTPNITVGSITAASATISGNVSIAGTLTYEDVTNIDSIGVVTARSSVIVGAGLSVVGVTTLASAGGITTAGGTLFAKQLNISGVSTFGNTVVGGATTQLLVNGNARITGILTVGTSSLTFDGNANTITGLSTITGSSTFTKPNLAGISSTISSTAVKVFVYDTRKDSDGGQWRKRTQHLSWYNETLNTATRGSRRDFPAVAVIVATSTAVTIYDGDDPDMPMWMVFNAGSGKIVAPNSDVISSIFAFNGVLCVTESQTYGGINIINFVNEVTKRFRYSGSNGNGTNGYWPGGISTRNASPLTSARGYDDTNLGAIVSDNVNDVAMTVLPNAPIDSATGLPTPTIAVATNGGVSIIKDDGTVISTSGSGYYVKKISFTKDYGLNCIISNNTNQNWVNAYVNDYTTINGLSYITYNNFDGVVYRTKYDPKALTYLTASVDDSVSDFLPLDGRSNAIGGAATGGGLTLFEKSLKLGFKADGGLVSFATTSYNTGWMHGDIKGAFLSDTSTVSISSITTYSDPFSSSSNWSFADNGTSGISGGVMTIEQNGSARGTNYTALNGVATGTKLLVQFTIVTGGNGTLLLDDDGIGAGAGSVTTIITATSTGTFSAIYTKTASNRFRFIRSSGTGNYTIDNLLVKPLQEADRSVNNNGLAVYGTITKSAVATGSNLVAYSGFGASNGLIQPYNSALDFGTGDYYMSVWAYGGSTDQVLMIRENPDTDANGAILIFQYSGYYAFYSRTSGTPSWTSFLSTAPYGNYWSHIYLVRRSGVLQGYVNGVLVGSTAFTGTVTNTIAQVSIGRRIPSVNTQYFTGSVALAKIGSGAPSPTQIAKIYNDEKALFQPNSQCTLYGTSDAVTALAYDDTTKLLSVGTSSGRSDFQGLERINNTTTAVTTTISASNGLIAEQ